MGDLRLRGESPAGSTAYVWHLMQAVGLVSHMTPLLMAIHALSYALVYASAQHSGWVKGQTSQENPKKLSHFSYPTSEMIQHDF